MVKQLVFATRVPGHVLPVGRPCGTWVYYVKDMGQQVGYRSLTAAEWNWQKGAMRRPIAYVGGGGGRGSGRGIVDGAKQL